VSGPLTSSIITHMLRLCALMLFFLQACDSGFSAIDHRVETMMAEARVGHIGLYRDEETKEPVPYYCKLPTDIANGPVLLIDPMLATGGSASYAATLLQEHGCRDVQMVCLVASPEGVRKMEEEHPELRIFTASLDRCLNEDGYILPGLGDAGDRIFGTV